MRIVKSAIDGPGISMTITIAKPATQICFVNAVKGWKMHTDHLAMDSVLDVDDKNSNGPCASL